MSVLKNLILPFLLPPGIFILPLVGYGIWRTARRHFFHGVSFLFLGILAWGLSIPPVGDSLLRPLESAFTLPEKPTGDVIVILGAGVSSERPDPLGKGAPSERMLSRILAGARLQKKLGIPVLVSGRGDGRDAEAVRSVILRYMKDLGVMDHNVIIENKSRNTAENAAFSAKICREKGFQHPILVTSAYHLKRASACFAHEGLSPTPFPSGFETWKGKIYSWKSFLPGDFRKSSIALREYLGLLYYHAVVF